jgi:L,D-peptidoglycan transpeptidase YkuD (ErfK/YbiS/YcfS/YnhG family)
MKMDFSRTERRFRQTLRQYAEVSKKETSEVINKKGNQLMRITMARTEKASASKIRAELNQNGLAYKLINKTGMKRAEIAAKVKKFISARARSAGYIRAGWFPAARIFGLRGGKNHPGKSAEKGTGKRATPKSLEATIENVTHGAVKVSGPALAEAMEIVRKDMIVYLGRKLRNRWGRGR